MSTNYPHSGIAQALAAKGRDGDTELLHVTKDEIRGLLDAAKANNIEMTRNPHTGIYEASWLSKAAKKIKKAVGPVFTKLRDVAQSAAVLVGNYVVPGSSMLTSKLVSKKAQGYLNSGIGQLAQMATGNLAGAGGGLSALRSGLGNMFKGGLSSGLSNLGSNLTRGLQSMGSSISGGISSLGQGVSNFIANPVQTLQNLAHTGYDKVSNYLSNLGKGAATGEGGTGLGGLWDKIQKAGSEVLNDPTKRQALFETAASLFGAANQPSGDGGGGGAGGGGNAPQAQFYNTSLRRVMNPNYGKPGEPFYITQEFTPGQFSSQYQEPTSTTVQGQAQAQPQAAPQQVPSYTNAQDFRFSQPVQAAGGGLMSTEGRIIGNAPRFNAGGELLTFNTGGIANTYEAGGKLLDGPGDGMSDSIQAEIRGNKGNQKALLADGEFVIPADVVSGLGNGSTKAGSKVLYSMMDRVRQARTGTTEQGKQIDPNKFVPA